MKKPLDWTTTSVTLEGLDPSAAPALSRQSCFLSALWTRFRLEVSGPRERQLEQPLNLFVYSFSFFSFFFGENVTPPPLKKNTLDKQPLDIDTSGHKHWIIAVQQTARGSSYGCDIYYAEE